MITTLDNKTALVVIDLQKGIASMNTAKPAGPVIAQAAKLAAAFREQQLPVVLVNVNPIGSPSSRVRAEQNKMPTDEAGQQQALAAMTAAGFFELVPQLDVQPGDILVTKKTWNAFYDTSLHDTLQKHKVTNIVFVGIATSIGVEGTARAAFEHGYNITFATDAMTDMNAASHEHSITTIFPRLGETGDTDTVLALLASRK